VQFVRHSAQPTEDNHLLIFASSSAGSYRYSLHLHTMSVLPCCFVLAVLAVLLLQCVEQAVAARSSLRQQAFRSIGDWEVGCQRRSAPVTPTG
jgi:hypothetical protein